jgi:hypothetical protein
MNDNNDDLQDAINGIVNGANEGATADVDATVEAGAPIDLGIAPAPALEGEDAPDMALPKMAVPDPGAGLMNADPESIEDQAAEEVTYEEVKVPDPVDGTLSETAIDKLEDTMEKATSQISDVKKSMIADLIPLMDKVSVSPEKQFGLYKELIDATHDGELIPGAYTAAKKIADDKERAEALLYLIDESE